MLALRQNLLVQFSIASFLILSALVIVLSVSLSNKIRSAAVEDLIEETVGTSSGRLLSAISPEDLAVPMTGERYQVFHEFVQQSIVSDRTARVKVWAKDGTVIYSNDPTGVGERFPTKPSLLQALSGGNAAEIKIPEDAENANERFLGTLMEVYTPIYFADSIEPAGAFEIYQYYEPTAIRIANLQRSVVLAMGIGFLVLYFGLVSIVWRGWKTINRQQKEIKAEHSKALVAFQAKSDFLSNVSHEMRTPLNAIVGTADLLADTQLDDAQSKLLEVSRASSENLLAMINDIIDFSESESGESTLEATEFNLPGLILGAVGSMERSAQEKDIDLLSEIQSDVPINLIGDPVRLRKILSNLLDNAIRFTELGQVSLQISNDPESTEPGRLLFLVSDTGIGISPENIGVVFDSFTQVDSSDTRNRGGTGLGLATCQKLVDMTGGRIWVESELGRGSRFYFTAEFQVPMNHNRQISTIPEATRPQSLEDQSPIRVLLVDDSKTNRMIFESYLEDGQFEIEIAENGEIAVGKFTNDPSYDLVLMDLQMPVMDGYTATKMMRQWEGQRGGSSVPIFALTAHAKEGDARKSRDAGCSEHFEKPVRKEQLLEAINNHLGGAIA